MMPCRALGLVVMEAVDTYVMFTRYVQTTYVM